MSGEEVRRVSRRDIQLVQNLIERCLQLYMSRKEVVETLLVQAKIEPGFTELVWQKLEEENQEFFKAYHLRLMVKNQIMIFNKLLARQVDYMRQQMSPSGIVQASLPNGSQTASVHQAPSYYKEDRTLPPARPNNLHHLAGPSDSLHTGAGPSNTLHNGRSVTHGSMHADNTPGHNERVDVSPNMAATQNSHLEIKKETNGVGGVLEHDYSNTSPFTFGVGGNILESRSSNGGSSISTFRNAESNSDTLNEKLPDTETTPFGFLGQIPRNFSLSDLTADFSHSFDILESYPKSPFVPPDNENLPDPTGRDYEEENKKLNGISEDFNYDDFSSD